jgi:hypothetical protein
MVGGMLGAPELFILLVSVVIPAVFYIRTLQRALERCSPASRTMPPYKVWLLLIPLFNLIWHFFVVSNVARSLGNEFESRNARNAALKPGKWVGIAMCILHVSDAIAALGERFGNTSFGLLALAPVLWLAGLICWIVYWAKISGYSRALRILQEAGTTA